MIRLLLAAALALAAAPVLAQPADPRVEAAFGNTIVSTYPDGRTGRLWLERDGSYRGTGRRGLESRGTWRVRGEELCLRQRRPFPAPFNFCTALVQGGIGTRWTGRAPTGETIRNELVAGR